MTEEQKYTVFLCANNVLDKHLCENKRNTAQVSPQEKDELANELADTAIGVYEIATKSNSVLSDRVLVENCFGNPDIKKLISDMADEMKKTEMFSGASTGVFVDLVRSSLRLYSMR